MAEQIPLFSTDVKPLRDLACEALVQVAFSRGRRPAEQRTIGKTASLEVAAENLANVVMAMLDCNGPQLSRAGFTPDMVKSLAVRLQAAATSRGRTATA